MTTRFRGAAAMAAVALLACGDDPTGPAAVAGITIEPVPVQTLTAYGQKTQLVAIAHDAFGRRLHDVVIAWQTRDPDALSVDVTGLVTARGNGSAFIVAQNGAAADSVLVTVDVPVGEPRLTMVSGDGQPGRAGRALPRPFIVKVTNGRGEPMVDHPVLWTVDWGDGLIDGIRLHPCEQPPPLSVNTDVYGRAEVSFTPTWFGASLVTARLSPGAGTAVAFTTDASDPGATLTVVSGTPQQGKSGEPLPVVLRARVTDGEGVPVPHVAVTWRIVSGSGGMGAGGCEFARTSQQVTARSRPDEGVWVDPGGEHDMHGVSWVPFVPTRVGRSLVAATLSAPPAVAGAPAVFFEIDAPSLLITLSFDYWYGFHSFFGPNPATGFVEPLGNVAVPVGTTVEWINYLPTARIASTTTPPGGAPFDSGLVDEGARFEFVPGVPGVWEFVDQVSGATGSLTAE